MFDRVVCINLDRRPDRWCRFQGGQPGNWPFKPIERIAAIDGRKCGPPAWYGQPPELNHPPRDDWRVMTVGAWGCLRSHVRVWEDVMSAGLDSVLIFEDDAVFGPDFATDVEAFLAEVPDDWGQIYLGGQHLAFDKYPPIGLSPRVIRGTNVNRTHAYAIRGETMRAAYDLMCGQWHAERIQEFHIDHRLGMLHAEHKAYCPRRWLVGQCVGASDVWGQLMSTCWWNEFGIVEREACVAAY